MVEDARFCHKCGRPTSGEAEIQVEIPRVAVTPPPLPVSPQIDDTRVSFANPAALRIAFAAAALSILLDSIPFISFLFVLWSMGAGFLAVWLYRRRTGKAVSVPNGVRLGWITGVFTFVILTVMVTVVVLAITSNGKLASEVHQQLAGMAQHDPNYQQALSVFENPSTLASTIIYSLCTFFVLLSLASVAGGALGARFSNKD